MNYSPEYAELQQQFHIERPDYGISGSRYADMVHQLAKKLGTTDILDYGCGKATLSKSLPFPIHNYDPFIPEYSTFPKPADLVVCTDVMEHVEEQFVSATLEEIASLANRAVFFQIATRPASKNLPDGRNAHITIRTPAWWLNELLAYFDPIFFQDLNGGFLFGGATR